MNIRQLPGGSVYAADCWLLTETSDGIGHAVVVDPSASAAVILQAVREAGYCLDAVLLTHGHFDHIFSVDALRRVQPGLPVCIHSADASMLTSGDRNAALLFLGEDQRYGAADRLLSSGDTVPVGHSSLTVLHTPGHSPGSVCFLDEADGILLTGDTLFANGAGRCDLWGGNYAALQQSLRQLKCLDPTLRIYPGHGASATLGVALDRVLYD